MRKAQLLALDAHHQEEAREGRLAGGRLADHEHRPRVLHLRAHLAHHDLEGVGSLARAVDLELDALQHDVQTLARQRVDDERVGRSDPPAVLQVLRREVHRHVEQRRVVATRELDRLPGGAADDGGVHIRERLVRRVERASDPRTAAEQPHLGPSSYRYSAAPPPGGSCSAPRPRRRPAAQVQPIARHRRLRPRPPLPLAAAVAAVAAALGPLAAAARRADRAAAAAGVAGVTARRGERAAARARRHRRRHGRRRGGHRRRPQRRCAKRGDASRTTRRRRRCRRPRPAPRRRRRRQRRRRWRRRRRRRQRRQRRVGAALAAVRGGCPTRPKSVGAGGRSHDLPVARRSCCAHRHRRSPGACGSQ